MKNTSSLFLAIGTALLLSLSFIARGGTYLAWVSLLPLLFLLKGNGLKKGVLLSWLSGGLFFNIIFYWIAVPVIDYGGSYTIPALLGLIIIYSLLGIFFAFFGLLTHHFLQHQKRLLLLIIPALWTLGELLRSFIFSPLPLGLLGHTQTKVPLFIQTADVYGTAGISYMVALINTFLFLLLTHHLKKGEVIIFCIIISALVSYGFFKLSVINGEILTIGIVQSNIPQDEKWDYSLWERNIKRHLVASREMSKEVDLIIWPESALPIDPNRNAGEWRRLCHELEQMEVPFLTGILTLENSSIYNNSFLMVDGQINQDYQKLWLVPFGEYIPSLFLFSFIRTGFHPITPGKELSFFQYFDLTWASPICYEILNSTLMRKMARESDFLINLSNEAWFKDTPGLKLLFQVLIMRTVELRRPIVKVANTGISGYVNDRGEIIKVLPPLNYTYGIITIGSSHEDSFYTKTGLLPFLLLLLILVSWSFFHGRKGNKS